MASPDRIVTTASAAVTSAVPALDAEAFMYMGKLLPDPATEDAARIDFAPSAKLALVDAALPWHLSADPRAARLSCANAAHAIRDASATPHDNAGGAIISTAALELRSEYAPEALGGHDPKRHRNLDKDSNAGMIANGIVAICNEFSELKALGTRSICPQCKDKFE
ncbi:hypothetical protein IF1G_06305 [Cordyceps javanica]|uniref:Uncharacterized protein n=1 Tax=Cordyceps javanica TaxID=43265 RepID=A0A545VUU4_9HYPO|nr:hypothetical protein IF1G_06305 [Cordyceps javanica]TQW05485.1 hypothetical protein IF2G_06607 [Cordyceps javanica]